MMPCLARQDGAKGGEAPGDASSVRGDPSIRKGEGMTRIRFARWAVVLSALTIIGAACAEADQPPAGEEDTPAEEGVFLMAADGVLSDTFMETPESEDMYFSGPAIPEESQAYPDFVDAYEQ